MVEEQKNFPKSEPDPHYLTENNIEAIFEDWKAYLQLIKQYKLNKYTIVTISNILNLIEQLREIYLEDKYAITESQIHDLDEILQNIRSNYINLNYKEVDYLLMKFERYLSSIIYDTPDSPNDTSKESRYFYNFSQRLEQSLTIKFDELILKIQKAYNLTNYTSLKELNNFFQFNYSDTLNNTLFENKELRNDYILLNECLDRILSIDNSDLIKNEYLKKEIDTLTHQFQFSLKLHFIASNINGKDIDKLIDLTRNLDQATSKFKNLTQDIESTHKDIINNIYPALNTDLNKYESLIASLEDRIQSLQAECSNFELAHYFKKEADKLKVDTDITHGWWTLTQEYIYHPYSRWLLLTLIGMISIFSLTFYLTFSLEANIKNYQDLIKYSPMYMVLGWFTWFSSKQFSYIKQLHDEYRYKYVLSKSYFAYRKEAENLVTDNKEALLLLLKCVIANISTSPVQSVRPDVHTPFSEILNTVSKVPIKSTDDKK